MITATGVVTRPVDVERLVFRVEKDGQVVGMIERNWEAERGTVRAWRWREIRFDGLQPVYVAGCCDYYRRAVTVHGVRTLYTVYGLCTRCTDFDPTCARVIFCFFR